MQDLKVALIQTRLYWEDRQANLDHFDQCLSKIEGTPDLIVLPEMFNTAFSMKPEHFSEPMGGDTFQWMRNKAAEFNAAFIGSWMVEEEGKYYNRLHFITPDEIVRTYDKRHLFRMGEENLHFTAGTEQLILEYKGWKIKPLICYDLRFPAWAKNNFVKDQYDVDLLLYIANWPASRANAWKTLLEARSIENQCCVIGVNRIGNDELGNDYSGHSVVRNAKGEQLAVVAENEDGIANATLSMNDLVQFRNKFTVGLDWDKIVIEK